MTENDNTEKLVAFPCGCGGFKVDLAGRTKDFAEPCSFCRRMAMFRPSTGEVVQLEWYAATEPPRTVSADAARAMRYSREHKTPGEWITDKFHKPKDNRIYTRHGRKLMICEARMIGDNSCVTIVKNGEALGYSTVEEFLKDICALHN